MAKGKQEESNEIPQKDDVQRDGPVGTLARGINVLDALIAGSQPMGLSEIAASVELEQSTTLRLLRTLEAVGYIIRSDDTRKYLPSPKALRPMHLLHPLERLKREARGLMEDLSQQLGKTVVMVIFLGGERMVIDIAQGANMLSPYYDNWLHGPLHATGPGKCLLARLSQIDRKQATGPAPFERYTEHTLTCFEQLEEDIRQFEQRGYAVVRDEYRIGISAVAAPIRNWQKEIIGCFAITGHTKDFNDIEIERAGKEACQAAQLLLYQAPTLDAAVQFCGL